MEAIDGQVLGDGAKEVAVSEDRIILQTGDDTIVLKQLIPDDAQRYNDLVSSNMDHLNKYGHGATVFPIEFQRELIARWLHSGHYAFGIWDEGRMVGSDYITIQDENENTGELGSWIAKEHTGQNYAARARKLLVDFAFNTLGLDEVFCAIGVGNEASRKSVESSGFTFAKEEDGALFYSLHCPEQKSKQIFR
jgi:RimJ/RimL family protein N-acetyltransferase